MCHSRCAWLLHLGLVWPHGFHCLHGLCGRFGSRICLRQLAGRPRPALRSTSELRHATAGRVPPLKLAILPYLDLLRVEAELFDAPAPRPRTLSSTCRDNGPWCGPSDCLTGLGYGNSSFAVFEITPSTDRETLTVPAPARLAGSRTFTWSSPGNSDCGPA